MVYKVYNMARLSQIPKIRQAYKLDDALTMTGFGIYNLYLFLTVGGFLMCVIIETMSMMFIVPAAKCDLKLSVGEQGFLSSISFFGVVASSQIWGFFADAKGRRNLLIISLITSAITSVTASIVESSWLFIFIRFVNGMCIGGASSITYAYLGEFHNDKYRPKIVSGVATFVAFGNMYLPGLAWVILPQEWSFQLPVINLLFRPWRLLTLVYAVPSIIFAIALSVLPESPKFLLLQGKNEEVLKILRKMYAFNTGNSEDDYLPTGIIWDGNVQTKSEKGIFITIWEQTKPLVKQPLMVNTLLCCVLQFGIFASTSGMIMWYPTLLNTMAQYVLETGSTDVTMCNAMAWNQMDKIQNSTDVLQTAINAVECNDKVQTDVFMISLIIGIGYAIVYTFNGLFINAIGKKTLLTTILVTVTISGLVSQYVIGYQVFQILVGIFVIGGVCVGLINAIVVDLFPTHVRAMALALSLMFGRFGAMVGTNAVGPILYNWCDYLFYIFTIDHIILLALVFLVKSPKTQKVIDVIT